MWCFVTEPSGLIHELILPKDSLGSDCLDKVCSRLNLFEKDYFGLRYKKNKIELWVNLRNLLCEQLVGKPPYRLYLAVKYFVKAQELQQNITRELFYSTIHQQLIDGKFSLNNQEANIVPKLVALKAQIECGDFDAEAVPEYSQILPLVNTWSSVLQKSTETEHLKITDWTQAEAKVEFIHVTSKLSEYGSEVFEVSSFGDSSSLLLVICTDGLRVYEQAKKGQVSSGRNLDENIICFKDFNKECKNEGLVKFIPYCDISTVSYKGCKFTIMHGELSNQEHIMFRLGKHHSTINLFRTFTEFHTFYQCNSVKRSVLEKCTRNYLNRLASIFKSNTQSGRKYLFDVVRTRRQAYDHAWSELNSPCKKRQSLFFHSDHPIHGRSFYCAKKVDEAGSAEPSTQTPGVYKQINSNYSISQDVNLLKNFKYFHLITDSHSQYKPSSPFGRHNAGKYGEISLEELKQIVSILIESRTCQVCMDAEVSTAFCPCGHVVCCYNCSVLCKDCPICRKQITYTQRVFLPGE